MCPYSYPDLHLAVNYNGILISSYIYTAYQRKGQLPLVVRIIVFRAVPCIMNMSHNIMSLDPYGALQTTWLPGNASDSDGHQ